MAFAHRHPIIILLTVTLLTGQVGCASTPDVPTPPSAQVRAQLGTIGVVSARFAPEVDFLMPVKGAASGAGRGAAQGMGAMLSAAGSCPQCGGPILALPLAAVVGAIGGGAAAVMEPIENVEEAETTLKAAVAGLNIQEEMRERVLQVARQQTRHPFVLVDQDPSAPGEEVAYPSLASEGIDTILEIGVLKLDLVGKWWEKNPLVELVMAVRTRLVNVADDKKLYDSSFEHKGRIYKFTKWSANDAQEFRDEVDRVSQVLSEKIVDVLFLVQPQEPETEGEQKPEMKVE